MRDRLFEIEKPLDALAFFREIGLWRYSRGDGEGPSIKFRLEWTKDTEGEPLQVTFNDLMYQRDFFESALSHGSSEWIRLPDIPGPARAQLCDGMAGSQESSWYRMPRARSQAQRRFPDGRWRGNRSNPPSIAWMDESQDD
jgi:hypothetical protein